jgi:hypothetical protein
MQIKLFYWSFVILFFVLLVSEYNYSQVSDLKQIPLQYKDVKESAVVALSDQELLFFFVNSAGDSVFSIRTTDLGITWQPESFIQKSGTMYSPLYEDLHLNAIKIISNRIILAWTSYRDTVTVLRSDDNGNTWLSPIKFRAASNSWPPPSRTIRSLNISNSPNGLLYLNFSSPSICWFRKSMDNGDTWGDSTFTILSQTNSSSSLIPIDDLRLIAFINQGGNKIIKLSSDDGGYTWSSPVTVLESPLFIKYSEAIITSDNKIWLAYQKETSIPYLSPIWTSQQFYKTSDIHYRMSEDFGGTWQPEKQLTKYIGDDNYLNLTHFNNTPILSFATQRFTNNYNLTFLIPGKFEEIKTPPYIIYSLGLNSDTLKNKCTIKAHVIDDESVSKVLIDFADGKLTGELFDDGNHDDGAAGDSIYANVFDTPTLDNYDVYLLDNNNVKMPINKDGVIASTDYPIGYNLITGTIEAYDLNNDFIIKEDGINLTIGKSGGKFDDRVFLFSSGFMMSGLDADSIWSNGVASATLVEDYIPGNVGSDPKQQKNSIYVVKADDKPFGNSWQIWKDAVERGAEFYDGDNDGIFNPIDKNFNGIWDSNEDMPMILGDETVWCVYNDGVPDSLRRWRVPPKDIEIAQTIFTSNKPGLENVMFLRYKILNKSFVDYDSVYFGFWADPDLGEAQDDRVGCDTILNSGMVYNDGPEDPDYGYGNNPPAFFTTLLQGPAVETGLNTDTAYNKLGELLGARHFSASRNQDIYAHNFYLGGVPLLSDPTTALTIRNNLMGKTRFGDYLDPCTFSFGQVLGGINCSEVNNRLWFSGDPVTQVGWIEFVAVDPRNLLSTGPFKLKSNEPVDIIAAYVVGRGTDALNSITVTREIVQGVIQEYENNFPRLTYKPGVPTNPIVSYELYQNYPNPFNPTTTIRYAIPEDGVVTIKVFDILGQQVATLKNEYQKANRYEIQFSSKGLASGVYIYKLQINDYAESKKMMLLK